MKDIIADTKLIAYCGLYCGACGSHLRGRCPGCADNQKASWCKIRQCCIENKLPTCAACTIVQDPQDCPKFNNFMSRIFGFLFRSDRRACLLRIKEIGPEPFAKEMAEKRLQSIRR